MSDCAACNPPWAGPGRINENHVGVRFGDGGKGWKISIDGEDVTHRCTEALAGRAGFVLLHDVGICDGAARSLAPHRRLARRDGHVIVAKETQ